MSHSKLAAAVLSLSAMVGAALVTAPAGAAGSSPGPSPGAAAPSRSAAVRLADRRVLVRFKQGTSPAGMAAAAGTVGGTVVRTFRTIPRLQVLQVPGGTSAAAAAASLQALPSVSYAERDQVVGLAGAASSSPTGRSATPQATFPNDPQFNLQWNWNNTGQTGGKVDADVEAPEAWDLATGSKSVVVGVIDTGVDYTHPDLQANVGFNAKECSGVPGVDDDGNGYVDDCYGVDLINGDSDPMDDFGHGTHVSGIIGAAGNNGIGVTGMNWNVTILACKSHDASGNGTIDSIIGCMDYVAAEKDAGYDVVATNNSYGGCPEACDFSQATMDAIASLLDHGILFVVAAGNNAADNDATPLYPTNYFLPNVISVAATTDTDSLAYFSDYGLRSVALGAPGDLVYSTWPNNQYVTLSGTSMATPHVAGLAALLKAYDPSLDWRGIRNLILAGGDVKSTMQGKTFTGRRMSAFGSLTCDGVSVSAALRPLASVTGGQPIPIAHDDITCAQPTGTAVTVTVGPYGKRIALNDAGEVGDTSAGDGISTALWNPCTPGTYTLTFSTGDSITTTVTASTPCIKLSKPSGQSGTKVRVRGSGYASNEQVRVLFDGAQVGQATANSGGAFKALITVPSVASGSYLVEGASDSGLDAVATFAVT